MKDIVIPTKILKMQLGMVSTLILSLVYENSKKGIPYCSSTKATAKAICRTERAVVLAVQDLVSRGLVVKTYEVAGSHAVVTLRLANKDNFITDGCDSVNVNYLFKNKKDKIKKNNNSVIKIVIGQETKFDIKINEDDER